MFKILRKIVKYIEFKYPDFYNNNLKSLKRKYVSYVRKRHFLTSSFSMGYIESFLHNNAPDFYEIFILKYKRRYREYSYTKLTKKRIEAFYSAEDMPLFNKVSIETYSKCNMTCSFCPANVKDDTRAATFMSNETFNDIIDQLAELNYSGMIKLYNYNEPLLDERIEEFCRIIKSKIPKAILALNSNGTLITLERFKTLIKYVDSLHLDNYNDKLAMIQPIQEIYNFCLSNPEYKEKVEIDMRLKTQILNNVGGVSPNRNQVHVVNAPCHMPFAYFTIKADGVVSPCCIDFDTLDMGNIKEKKLIDIWNSDKFNKFRKRISVNRQNVKECKNCDVL